MQLEAPWGAGASSGGASYMERGEGGAPGSGLGLKPQDFSGVITMRASVWGVNPCLHHDHSWGLRQTSVCDFSLRKSSPPILGWTSMTRLVSLGGHGPLGVGFQSRDKKNEDVTWMCPVDGLWELKPWPQPWSPASLWDWMDGVQGLDPTLDLLGVCVGGHLLFMLTLLNNPLLFTCHTVIWFTVP